jgi:hypothetical protein
MITKARSVAILFLAVATIPITAAGIQGRIIVDGPPAPANLTELTGRAQTIVEASVASAFPATRVADRGVLTTDFVVRVMTTIKGDPPLEFVVRQLGGSSGTSTDRPVQYALMKPGERYILFLIQLDDVRNRALPARAGLKRYEIMGQYGAMRLDSNKVVITSDYPDEFRKNIDKIGPSRLVLEIQGIVAKR